MDDRSSIIVQERYALAAKALVRKAAQARLDPVAFFEFAIREEHSHQKLKASAHQRLFFEFVMAHRRCAVRMPPGFSKSFLSDVVVLRELGEDPSSRCAFVSGSEAQAEKGVALIRGWIDDRETFPELGLVYPELRRSSNLRDVWSNNAITVERPSAIRDPSVRAFGYGTKGLLSSRLKLIVVDDLLNDENTGTKDQRDAVMLWFGKQVLSRLDPGPESRIIVTNTYFAQDDIIDRLEAVGWPLLEMDAEGNVRVANTSWDSDGIRPSNAWSPKREVYRLTQHDPDPKEQAPLWPSRFGPEVLREIKAVNAEYPLLYLNQGVRAGARRCQVSWVEKCKTLAVEAGIHEMPEQYAGPLPVFAGVDLAFSKNKGADRNAIFVFAAMPDGRRLPLHADYDSPETRWSVLETVTRIGHVVRRYNATEVRVESNGAQSMLLDVAWEVDVSLPLVAHHTSGKTKHDVDFGVVSLFSELERGGWMIPCSPSGQVDPRLEEWIQQLYDYREGRHVGDLLMACWFAREGARSAGHPSMTQEARARFQQRQEVSISMAVLGR